MATFAKMSRAEWNKPVSGSRESRVDVFINAIKAGDPVSDIEGKDVYVKNSRENIDRLKNYLADPTSGGTVAFDLKNGGTILSNEIGKSPLFGGQGAGGGATGETAKFESLQCLYIAAVLGEGLTHDFSHYTIETLEKYKDAVFVSEPFDRYTAIDGSWHISGFKIAEKLVKAKYVTTRHTLHRGDKKMDSLYTLKNKLRRAEGLPAINHDKWNPGDIWAVKRGLNIESVLDASSVASLNASLKKAYDDRTIVGISLKQINSLKKRAKHSEYNLGSADLGVHKYTRSILKSERRGSSYWTFKGGYIYFDGNKRMDVRAPSSMGALNVEIQGKGARGGRAGYAAIMYASQMILKKKLSTNAELKTRARGMMGGKNEKAAKELWNKVNKIHSDVKWNDFWMEMQSVTVDRIHANLGATEIIDAVNSSNKKMRDEFVSYLVNMAGSKTNDSSVYVKVEAA